MRNKLVGIGVCCILFLGGCYLSKNYSYEEITKGGKIDVEKAKASGYVSLEEKEKLGYYTIESSANKKVQKKALEQQNELFDHLKPQIEASLGGREVEMLGVNSPFPYEAVDVSFRSKEEPIVTDSVTIGLSDNGYFEKGAIKSDGPSGFMEKTVEGLYAMAYRKEIQEMKEYIKKEYPQYEAYPVNMRNSAHQINEYINISISYKTGDVDNNDLSRAEQKEIFELYKKNKNRTDEEWKTIFESKNHLDYLIYLDIVIKNGTTLPTELMVYELLDDMKSNLLFEKGISYGVMLNSNFQDTNNNRSLSFVNKAYD